MKTVVFALLIYLMPYFSKRQVLIFYSKDGATLAGKQLGLLNNQKKELEERDIVIHTYTISADAPAFKKWKVPASNTFTFILAGKDGTEALRSATIVSPEKLFATIDAMPMRKEEIKNKE